MKEMKGAKKVGESRRRRRRRRPQGRFIEICCRWWEFPTSLIAAVMRGHLRILAGSVETQSFGFHVISSFIISSPIMTKYETSDDVGGGRLLCLVSPL